MKTTSPNELFNVCPDAINGFSRQDFHTEVRWELPAVILELVEHSVVLPVIGYKRGAIIYAIEFRVDKIYVKKAIKVLNQEVDHEDVQDFKPSQMQDAIQFLLEIVTKEV